MTMDDFFVQNKFASTIVRESSPGMLQNVKETENGGQLLDGRKVEEKLEAYKKKLWSNPKGVKAEELEGNPANRSSETNGSQVQQQKVEKTSENSENSKEAEIERTEETSNAEKL